MNLSIWSWIPGGVAPPLAFYAFVAIGLALCLYLFATVKAELRSVARRRREERQRLEALEEAVGEKGLALQSLATDLREIAGQTGMLVPPAPTRSGLNLSKRTHVLRLHRAGQDCAAIAASLGLPRAEVELLIKVHRIAMQQI